MHRKSFICLLLEWDWSVELSESESFRRPVDLLIRQTIKQDRASENNTRSFVRWMDG